MAEAPGRTDGPGRPDGPGRLDDTAVRGRLAVLDDLLERLEQAPGATAGTGLDAVRALTDVYGEALARLTALLGTDPAAMAAVSADELLTHLLVLHGVHPDPPEARIRAALARLGPELAEHGVTVEPGSVVGTVATIRLGRANGPAPASGGGCGGGCGTGPGPAAIADAVRDAVLAVAPEMTEVRTTEAPAGRPARAEPAFLPLESLRLRPTPIGSGS
jgi:hypothetical protein